MFSPLADGIARSIYLQETRTMSEIKYEIVKKVGVLSKSASGWAKELNLISWNDREPK